MRASEMKICSTTLALIALLMMAAVPRASGQVDKKADGHESSALRVRAEELFKNALLMIDTKEWKSVLKEMQEAMGLWMQTREPEKAARAALQTGDRFKQARMYQESLICYRQALNIKPLPAVIEANVYTSIAQVYAELSENDLAMGHFRKALDLAQDASAQALALTGMAELHHRQGERDQALTLIARAQQLKRQLAPETVDAALLYLTGQINQEENRIEQARTAFEEALTMYQEAGDVDGQVRVLCSMSSLSLLTSSNQAALDQARQATELAEKQKQRAGTIADRLNARELLRIACLTRARAERATGQKDIARQSYYNAIRHDELIWWVVKISTETSAIAFRQASQALYGEYVDLIMEQGGVADAYGWADLAKARAIRGVTEARRKNASIRNGDGVEIVRELSHKIAELRTQMLSSDISLKEQTKLQNDIRAAEYALGERRVQYEMGNFRDRLVWSEAATCKWVQDRLSQDNSVLLEFLLGETRSFAWLITPGGISAAILPSRKEIEKDVGTYLETLTTPPSNRRLDRDLAKSREQATTLFSKLFGSLARQIVPGQKLIVVPDGVLHYLPFETLINESRYLVQDHQITYSPSASMLRSSQDTSRQTHGEQMELLAFGDPNFEPGSTAARAGKSASGSNHLAQTLRSAQGYSLPSLPRTRDEVKYIAGLFPSDRRHIYLGKDSTEDAFKHESLRDYKRLHFATHSLINEGSPSRSAVVFTLDNDPQEDGFLEAGEISELDLDCDLVVLSACQTGRGKLFPGEGIVGLSRAFLGAGARSVVVSLWNVTDISTNQLMKHFYQQLVRGVGNAEALRSAKLQMIGSSGPSRHPYYWASFVMIGNP